MNGFAHTLQRFGTPSWLAAARRSRVASWFLSPPGAVGLAVFAFVAITAWWLSVDTRVPDFDSGKNLNIAFRYHDLLADGKWLVPVEEFNIYPPLVHLVGAAAVFIGGVGVKGPVLAQNLIFVPLLAVGCYGAASVAYNRTAGVLAACFALGTPMVMSQFHVFMLDAPMAAMVAVSVWLILASNRFRSWPYSLAAGLTVGLGMMTKNTFVLFVAGLLLVVVIRGAWRNWPRLLAFGAIAAAMPVPWLLTHYDRLSDLTTGATGGAAAAGTWWANVPYPDRWTLADFAWYGWNMINNQLYLPLTLLFGVGLAWAAVRWVRTRARDDYTPELIVGGFVGYFTIALIALNDPRYTLPCLVYVAVLGTGWIVQLRRPARQVLAAAVVAIAVVNTAMVSGGVGGGQVVLDPFNGPQSPIKERQFTLVSSYGFVEGGPRDDDRVLELMKDARRDGTKQIYFVGGSLDYAFFNGSGLTTFARMAGLGLPPDNDPSLLGEKDISLLRRMPLPGDPRPCTTLDDGSGVYVLKGKFMYNKPFDAYRRQLTCPLDRA
jgi:hypothetical protein